MTGTHLGPYEIIGLLGAGGMGEVYRACDTRLGREVAIKVLPAAFSADKDRLRRLEQEAQAVGTGDCAQTAILLQGPLFTRFDLSFTKRVKFNERANFEL